MGPDGYIMLQRESIYAIHAWDLSDGYCKPIASMLWKWQHWPLNDFTVILEITVLVRSVVMWILGLCVGLYIYPFKMTSCFKSKFRQSKIMSVAKINIILREYNLLLRASNCYLLIAYVFNLSQKWNTNIHTSSAFRWLSQNLMTLSIISSLVFAPFMSISQLFPRALICERLRSKMSSNSRICGTSLCLGAAMAALCRIKNNKKKFNCFWSLNVKVYKSDVTQISE